MAENLIFCRLNRNAAEAIIGGDVLKSVERLCSDDQ
jgi:hypothetical protein